MMNLFDIAGRTIVLSGGMGQLGKQYISVLLDSGANVAVLDISIKPDTGEFQVMDEHLIYIRCDITKKSELLKSLEIVQGYWGTPYGLINNAALDSPPNSSAYDNGPFEDYPEDSWDKVISVNIKGVFLSCQVFGSAMAKENIGSIINISSIYGYVSPNQNIYEYRRKKGEEFYKPPSYSASKSAIFNFTRYLATYWGKKHVRVNTLVLGGVFNNQDSEFLDNYCGLSPVGRMADENEYNGAVIFLLSDASSYMTGSSLILDGGWTAW